MNKDVQLLAELKQKKKLTGAERAQVKMLERKISQSEKPVKQESKSNIFATKPTTKINPLPIRFSNNERTGITELANDIKTNNLELVITELGSEREINDTKLVRAAVYLLKKQSHEEIVDAIKQVKLNMIR